MGPLQEVKALSFAGDTLAVASSSGVLLYDLPSHRHQKLVLGAVSLAECLPGTQTVAYVGAGEHATLSPRLLRVVSIGTGSLIKELSFPTSVLQVALNASRLVVLLHDGAHVYDTDSLQLLCIIPAPSKCAPGSTLSSIVAVASGTDNPDIRPMALTPCREPCLLALPSGETNSGSIRVYNLSDRQLGQAICEVPVHRSPVARLAWSADASMLACASRKGTVLRVLRMPQASLLFSCRRGALPTTITSLAFSPPNMEPPFLTATSTHGTLHLFRLERPAQPQAAPAQGGPGDGAGAAAARAVTALASAAAAGVLHTMSRVPGLQDMVEPLRAVATIKLPNPSPSAACLIQPALALVPDATAGQDGKAGGQPDKQQQQGPPTPAAAAAPEDALIDPFSLRIQVATKEGILIEYGVHELRSPAGPHCILQGEWALVPSGT